MTTNLTNTNKTMTTKIKNMFEVWEDCERPDHLFYMLEKHAPLTKKESVTLAIMFAESVEENRKDEPETLTAAKNWLANPTEENQRKAAEAGRMATGEIRRKTAAWAARAAGARAAGAWTLAAEAAAAAPAAAAVAVAAGASRKQQCDMIRSVVPNPFN